jgi:SAM-dependent methyltransferase
MPDRTRARSSVRTAVVWHVLRAALERRVAEGDRDVLEVLDVGGGTGRFAVPLAELGHVVTVLEPSPDALASLDRRVAEAGVGHLVRAVQGDAANIRDVVPGGQVDVVLCHGVLEFVEDRAEVAADLAWALRSGGVASILAANRNAAVLSRAVAGHIAEARHAFDDPDGRWGARDPLPRRFSPTEVLELLGAAGLDILSTHGVRVFSDLVPSVVVEGEAGTLDALVDLEVAVAAHPAFHAVATQVHVLARRP